MEFQHEKHGVLLYYVLWYLKVRVYGVMRAGEQGKGMGGGGPMEAGEHGWAVTQSW